MCEEVYSEIAIALGDTTGEQVRPLVEQSCGLSRTTVYMQSDIADRQLILIMEGRNVSEVIWRVKMEAMQYV